MSRRFGNSDDEDFKSNLTQRQINVLKRELRQVEIDNQRIFPITPDMDEERRAKMLKLREDAIRDAERDAIAYFRNHPDARWTLDVPDEAWRERGGVEAYLRSKEHVIGESGLTRPSTWRFEEMYNTHGDLTGWSVRVDGRAEAMVILHGDDISVISGGLPVTDIMAMFMEGPGARPRPSRRFPEDQRTLHSNRSIRYK